MTSLLLCCLAVLATAPEPPPGEWEGEVALPGRPLVVNVDFRQGQARVDLVGSQPLPLREVKLDGEHVRFALALPEPLTFDGTRAGEALTGTARLGEQTLSFSLRHLPELPAPGDRVQAWEQDLQQLLERFLVYDRSFSPEAREQFRQALAGLRASLKEKSDAEVIVELARALALAGNGHTRLYLLRNRTELRRHPVRVWWFSDGLFVVKATPEHRDLLGCRVTHVEGRPVEAAKQAVDALYSGSASWKRYMSSYTLTSPEVLHGLHLAPDMEQVRFSFTCGARKLTRALKPLPLVKKERPTEAWWDLAPRGPEEDGLVSALEARKGETPLALRHPERSYSFEYLEGPRVLYFQFNRAQEQADAPLAAFGEKLLATLGQRPVKVLVVDLRFNTGGNLYIAEKLMERLHAEAARVKARVFVLTGRATFSAGIAHVAQWKQLGHVTLVGEPVGDALDMWAEGGNVVLPHSRLRAHYANGFHAWSKREYPERKPYFLDMDVDSVEPDVPVQASSRDWLAGRDAELEAALRAATR